MNWMIILCYFNLLWFVSCENLKDKIKISSETNIFIPTHEWQVVRKGQPVPKGLHVRINLETGLTEAKLLEEDLNDDRKSALLTINQPEKEDDRPGNEKISKEILKEALKHIKNEDLTPDDEDAMKRVTSKFKKYDEIKKELKDMNLSPKTDSELLKELLINYEEVISNKKLDNSAKNIQIYNILEDIEYLVHQIDNANEFVSIDGFNRMIYKNFNSTNVKIKCQVLNILGSSVQNNPTVQIYALETGCIDKLLRLLVLEVNNEVLSRTIYALSSVLRRFPIAQQQFIKNGGLSVFTKMFEKPDKLKIQIRMITLLYDLIMEHNNAIKHTESPDYANKLKQYNNVVLKSHLVDLKWCDIFSNILKSVLKSDENDHDSVEKCLNVINLVQDICLTTYNVTEIKKMFYNLHIKYTTLAENEIKENALDEDVPNHTFYFQKMKEITGNLVNSLYRKTEL